jgi:hypothetical protein
MTTIDAATAMINAILDAISQWGNVGCMFASLERIDGFRGGTAVLTDPDASNVIIWENMSSEAAVVCHLVNKNEIHFRRTSFESYQLDGRVLRLPIERKTTPPGTKCWRPTAICAGPPIRIAQRGER